jgi:hypothetical protein
MDWLETDWLETDWLETDWAVSGVVSAGMVRIRSRARSLLFGEAAVTGRSPVPTMIAGATPTPYFSRKVFH